MTGRAVKILIMAGLLVGWIVARAGAQAVPEAKGGRPLLFLGNQSLPPMSYIKDDAPVGVVVDLVRALAKRMERPVEIRLMNWSEAQNHVLDGQADALLQFNSSPERLKLYDFSEPLLSSEFTIFTTTQRQGITSMEDLRGLKVGVEAKGLPILLLKQDSRIFVESIPDFAQGFEMLAAGSLDAVVADRWVGSYVLAENDIQGVKLVDSPISRSHSAIAVKKGNRLLLDAINEALAEIRQDGTYDRIIRSWKSKEIVFKTREQLRQQAWLFATILTLLFVALVGVTLLVREIRRRKHVEAKLRQSEERLRFALDAAQFGTFDYNPQTGGIIWDTRMKQIWGVTTEEDLAYSEVLGRVHPEDREQVQQIFRTALSSAGDGSYEAEYRIHRLDGSIRWNHARGRVHFLGEKGHRQAVRVIGIEQDITDRRQAEQALRESRAKLEAALASMVDAVFISDVHERFVDFNDAFATFHRFKDKGECLRTLAEYTDILEVFMADGQPAPLEQWAVPRALRGERVTDAEYTLRRKDTGETWVGSYSFGPIRDEEGSIVGSVVVGRDITERKAVEKRVEESERQLRLITETIPDMLWTGLANGFIDYCNHRWLNHTGMTLTEVQGTGWMKALHPEDVEHTGRVWAEACHKGDRYEVEQRLRSANGEYRWFLTRAYPLKDDEGRVIKWYGANTDITRLKQSEIELQRSHQEKVALLKEVHHRVKNNLQVVASLVGLQTYGIKSPEALDILKDTRNRVCSMALLHEVLYRSKDLARIGFSTYLHDLCRHIVTSFRGVGQRINVETRAEDINMPLDKAVPCGLLVNELVSNALKHAFPGDRPGSVVVELAHSSPEMLRLTIQDDGVGLPPGIDLQNTPTLGLQLVFDLARQILGHVTVSSSPGGGAIFSVAFPLTEEAHCGGSE